MGCQSPHKTSKYHPPDNDHENLHEAFLPPGVNVFDHPGYTPSLEEKGGAFCWMQIAPYLLIPRSLLEYISDPAQNSTVHL